MRKQAMKRSRFSDEQIIGILKEHQAGLSATKLCRKYGVSDATFYKWHSKYGGMDVSEAKRLKSLEEENGKLKRLPPGDLYDGYPTRECRYDDGTTRTMSSSTITPMPAIAVTMLPGATSSRHSSPDRGTALRP